MEQRRHYVERGGLIRAVSDDGDALGAVVTGNLLAEGAELDVDGPGRLVVSWSGTLGDELFGPSPMNWMAPGAAALDAACARARSRLDTARKLLCLHPHARHVLSDVPSCRSFLERHQNQPFAIVLAPASMMEPAMLDDVDDHLRRIVESLADRCAMIRLDDVVVSDDGRSCRAVPLGDGLLPPALLRELLESDVPSGIPIVLGAERLEQQLEWLGLDRLGSDRSLSSAPRSC